MQTSGTFPALSDRRKKTIAAKPMKPQGKPAKASQVMSQRICDHGKRKGSK